MNITQNLFHFVPAIVEYNDTMVAVRPIAKLNVDLIDQGEGYSVIIKKDGIKDVDSESSIPYNQLMKIEDLSTGLQAWIKQEPIAKKEVDVQ